jgi:phage-related protein
MFFSQLAQEILPMLLPLFGEFVNGALPALTEFMSMLFAQSSSVLPLFVELAKVLVESLLPVVPLLIAQTEPLRDSFVELVQALVPLIAMYLPGLINYLPVLIKYFIFAVQYTEPFIQILALLVRAIAKAIDVLHAIIGKIAEFMAAVRGISSGIQSIFSGSEGWLTNAGDRIISGLINGIKNAANTKLQSTLRWVTSLIPDWKGPEEKDRKLLQPAGRAVMGGFMMGIERSLPDLRNLLGGVTGELPRSINPNPSAGGGRGGVPANLGPYVVQVGDKTMAQFVIDAITGQPKVVADALSEGNRRRGYLNTGRAS